MSHCKEVRNVWLEFQKVLSVALLINMIKLSYSLSVRNEVKVNYLSHECNIDLNCDALIESDWLK